MGSLTGFVALTWMVATLLLCSQAAPVTEFFGPPQTIEGDSNVEYDEHPKVEEMERFHRTYKNGTVEFKMALSNGHVQYQRIHTKIVDGNKVPVYEGYISEQYKDGRYGTRYYAADENGYRSSSVIVENHPPKLPTSGSYSSSLPRNIQDELAPLNEDDTQTKTKTILDNLIEIENDLEEDQLSTLHLGSNITNETTITTESETLKQRENEEILENKNSEDPSVISNFKGVQTDLPINIDQSSSTTALPSISENSSVKVSEESESSTLPTLREDSSTYGVVVEFSTEQPIIEATTVSGNREESSDLSVIAGATIRIIEEELAGRSLNNFNESEILSEDVEDLKVQDDASIDIVLNLEEQKTEQSIDVISEATTETFLNDGVTSAGAATAFDNEAIEPSTEVSEIDKVRIDDETSSVLKYPLDDADSELTTLSPNEVVSISFDETKKVLTEQTSLDVIKEKPTESIVIENESSLAPENENKSTDVNELPTEKSNSSKVENEKPVVSIEDNNFNSDVSSERSFEDDLEAKTESFLNDEVQSNEQLATFKSEDLEKSITGVPELNEVRIVAKISSVSLEDAKLESTTLSPEDNVLKTSDEEDITTIITEQPLFENTDDKSIENTAFENESNSDLPTSSISLEIENKSTKINGLPTENWNSGEIVVTTDLPLGDSITNTENETGENLGVITDEKDARSFDFSKVLPLSEKNSRSIVKKSGVEEGTNISDTLKNSEINEETTNEENREKSSEDGASTELPKEATTQKIDLEASSSEGSEDSITGKPSQISTNQTLVLTSSEENSSEENKDKLTEAITEHSEESSGEKDGISTAQRNGIEASSSERSDDNTTEKEMSTGLISALTNYFKENSSEERREKSPEDGASTELPKEQTTQTIDLEASSSEGNEDNITDKPSLIPTNQTLVITSSEENSNEEKEKLTEDVASTEHSEESSGEKDSTEAENLTTTEETNTGTSGVEVEFYPPVIHF